MNARRGLAATNLVIGVVVLAAVAVAVWALLGMDPRGARGPRTGQRYVADVQAAGRVDPAWIGWEESAAPVAVEMEEPRALAVDAHDRIHVIGDRLVILTAEGTVAWRSAELAEDYRGLAVDAEGRIFATAPSRVDVLEVRGAELELVGRREIAGEIAGEGVDLSAIVLTPHGVFVADEVGCRVFELSLDDGDRAEKVFAEGFHVPSGMDLTATPGGDVVTVDPGRHRVQVRDVYGDVVRAFGDLGSELEDFHGCCNPIALGVLADGRTVTAEKGLGVTRVKVYDGEGRLQSVVAGPEKFDERPDGPPLVLDVAVDSRGRVLVLDPERGQVRVFTPKGSGGPK